MKSTSEIFSTEKAPSNDFKQTIKAREVGNHKENLRGRIMGTTKHIHTYTHMHT
jgi:hypothetical protein